ncbi:sigma factor-like helix-turn-helix DNA-binding protein [Streptomyces filamentosus]|uniref:sigma factor-like helix-turn-helix DNA-binding protein n=1 Tax=Streptomyces filamentosus TaxID=67294 RepID=UPI0033E3EF82
MDDDAVVTALGARFDAEEERLRGVALRVLGAGAETEAAGVLRRVRAGLEADAPAVARLWLTALVVRACLEGAGREEETDGKAGPAPEGLPEGLWEGVREGARGGLLEGLPEALDERLPEGLDETVLLGFLAVLDRLGAPRRLAYLLHDVFGLPPGETARVMGCTPAEAARRARRARERLRGGEAVRGGGTAWGGGAGRGRETVPGGDDPGRRVVVDAFLAAARARDAVALTALLDPEAVVYAERGPVHGIAAVAAAAALAARSGDALRPALVDGAVGVVAFAAGRPVAAVAFGFRRDRISAVDITTGAERLRALDVVLPEE